MRSTAVKSGVWVTNQDFIKWDKHPIETLHAEFCKSILKVQRKTPNNACRAELGRYPIVRGVTIHSAHETGRDTKFGSRDRDETRFKKNYNDKIYDWSNRLLFNRVAHAF